MTYSVPSLATIAAVKGTNGYKVVSTFSGAGGSSLGFEMAGYSIVRAHEFIDEAANTYEANHIGTPVDRRDIREVSAEDILNATGLKVGELDLLEGSPPCSSFSTAGKREKAWGKVKAYSDKAQRSDDLFYEYARLLQGLQPKVFVAENVSGLVKGTAKGYFLDILKTLKESGYRVEVKLLDAQWLGVPQARTRVIFVGVREDLKDENGKAILPAFPTPLKYRYSINDALAGVSPIVEKETDIARYAIGAEWELTPIGGSSSKYFSLTRPDPDKPCPTLTATAGVVSAASVVHPTLKRKFSVAEAIRLSSFPDDFKLTGTYSQKIERLGRSVPPLLMKAVAETVRDSILARSV